MKFLQMFLSVALFAGCASMNDVMTPSMQLIKDDFDG